MLFCQFIHLLNRLIEYNLNRKRNLWNCRADRILPVLCGWKYNNSLFFIVAFANPEVIFRELNICIVNRYNLTKPQL